MTYRKVLLITFGGLLVAIMSANASAEEGRIPWKRPTRAESDRKVSDMAMNDSILRKGDIVVTDRGFFLFRGFSADGTTADFVEVPNPIAHGTK